MNITTQTLCEPLQATHSRTYACFSRSIEHAVDAKCSAVTWRDDLGGSPGGARCYRLGKIQDPSYSATATACMHVPEGGRI